MRVIRIRKIRFVLVALIISIMQQVFVHRYSYGYAGLDLIAVMGAFTAIMVPTGAALWSCLGLGVLRDLGTAARLGGSALAMLPAVLMISMLKDRFYRSGMAFDIIFTLLFMLSFGFVYAAGAIVFSLGTIPFSFFYHAIGYAVFSSLLVPPLFALFRSAGLVEERKTTF